MQPQPSIGQTFGDASAFPGAKFTRAVQVLIAHVQHPALADSRDQGSEYHFSTLGRGPDQVPALVILEPGRSLRISVRAIGPDREPASAVVKAATYAGLRTGHGQILRR